MQGKAEIWNQTAQPPSCTLVVMAGKRGICPQSRQKQTPLGETRGYLVIDKTSIEVIKSGMRLVIKADTMGQALWLSGKLWALVHTLAAALLVQLPTSGLGKAVKDGSSTWALATHMGDQEALPSAWSRPSTGSKPIDKSSLLSTFISLSSPLTKNLLRKRKAALWRTCQSRQCEPGWSPAHGQWAPNVEFSDGPKESDDLYHSDDTHKPNWEKTPQKEKT